MSYRKVLSSFFSRGTAKRSAETGLRSLCTAPRLTVSEYSDSALAFNRRMFSHKDNTTVYYFSLAAVGSPTLEQSQAASGGCRQALRLCFQ